MNLVLFTHPASLGLRSQEHFAQMLVDAFGERGHRVTLRRAPDVLRQRLPRGPLSKWAGYVDQYLLFPRRMRAAMRGDPAETLYVFCDQALGPLIPHAAHRPHVVHCHDLLALRSALGDIPENPTSLTGRLYQRYIRAGFRRARHFISISERSRLDLHRFGGVSPTISEVVYNGLNHPYEPLDPAEARRRLREAGLPVPDAGCLLHVGGGQWYKNPEGVLGLYAAYVRERQRTTSIVLPLWMVSPPPTKTLAGLAAGLPEGGTVRFVQDVSTAALEAMYSSAAALLFPSLAEGFGWPIVEAMACGCPVVTTAEAPMTEIGGGAVTYLPRLMLGDDAQAWARQGAQALIRLIDGSADEKAAAAATARRRARRFCPDTAIDLYLEIYERVLRVEGGALRGGAAR